ncbi:MAG: hypothetical protein QOG60_1790, partial [Frankiaceae bacterium]|nr:hypothetical protein [Frankiaceae bacterium]
MGSSRRLWTRLGLLVVLLAPLAACGSGDGGSTRVGATATRTPEFSVSSTFSLPTL